MIKLETPLYSIRGIGPKFFERLEKFGIKNIRDLLWHFPFRYEDFSKISKPLSNLLAKDVKFGFSNECKTSFETLKSILTTAPIIQPPN